MGGFPSPFGFQASLLPDPVLEVGEWNYNMGAQTVETTLFFTRDMDTSRIPIDSATLIRANGVPLASFTYSWDGPRELSGLKTGVTPKPPTPLTSERDFLIGNLFGVEGGPAGRWDATVLEDTT